MWRVEVAMSPLLALPPGQTIYFGDVYAPRAATPLYVYERRVDGPVATHITRDLGGAVVYAESAEHEADYTLVRAELLVDQLGRSAALSVDGGSWAFRWTDERGAHTRVERASDPLLTGPTAVGWILAHDLSRPVRVRFAALDRGRSYAFTLARRDAHTVTLSARSPWVALAIRPVVFTFDDAGRLASLDGRVPPKVRRGERWRPLDAHVSYRFVADRCADAEPAPGDGGARASSARGG